MNKTTNQNVEGNNDKNQQQGLKTFKVYHVENYDSGSDGYLWGQVEAKDIEDAEDKAIYTFLTMDRKDVIIESFDEKESFIEYETQFFDENGNQVEQDENDDKQSYITHSLRIVEVEE